MNGYALYGRDPVFADVDAHIASEDAAEARAEAVDQCINDAVDELLCAADDCDALIMLASEAGNTQRRVELRRIYNQRTGECEADSQDEWTRVMLMCEVEHLPALRQQWLDWARGHLAEYSEVIKVAERMADDDAEQAREDYELARVDA
jgi:hypothetical protein